MVPAARDRPAATPVLAAGAVVVGLICQEAGAGLAVTLGRTRLSYTYVVRSKEFEGQPDMDRFGSVAVSVKF